MDRMRYEKDVRRIPRMKAAQCDLATVNALARVHGLRLGNGGLAQNLGRSQVSSVRFASKSYK